MISGEVWKAAVAPRKWHLYLVVVMAIVMLVTDTAPVAEAQARS